jgi:apolipoprotein N-acyltransferase
MLSDQKTLLLDFFDVKFFQTSIILLIIFLAYKFFKSNILLKLEKAWQNHIQNIFLSFFSGICFAFGLEPFNNFIAVFLAFFVIYNLYLNDKSLKEILICSTSFCVSYVFLSLRWIYFAPLNFDGFEIFAPLALLVFIIYFSLYFFFFSLSFSFMSRVFLRKSNIEKISFFVGPIVFSFLFIFIFEFLRSIGKFGFPWNLISTIFLDFEFAQNLIHKFGIFICGFFIILIFAIIFNIINALYKKNFSDFIKSFIFLFLLIFLYFLVNQKP